MAKPMRRRGERGFTVIELLIGAVVMLLVASAGLPTLAEWRARHRVSSAAETLAADLQKARWAAIERAAPMYVSFNPAPHWCYAIATRPDCPCDGSGAACALKTVSGDALPGVALQVDQALLAFDPRRGSTTPGGVASFAAGRYAIRVSAEAVGRADLCAAGAPIAGYEAC